MYKTNKSMAKRFKVTGTGKVMRRSPNRRHLMRNKTAKQKRLMAKDKQVAEGFVGMIRQAAPGLF